MRNEAAVQTSCSGLIGSGAVRFKWWHGSAVTMALVIVLAGGVSVSGGDVDWPFRPLTRPDVPPAAGVVRNPIDAFIQARLAEHRLAPAPEADRRTLLRRVSLDLVGLPPTPDEMQAFLEDPSPRAYESVVDRLLTSPRHGERWARHWIDVVHFAETHGHDQDRIRTNAWPYRDYLVASFNMDKPYGRFVQEQVAGDVLFPHDPQATVALGMVAAGPWDESSLRDIREDTIDRQIGRYLDRDDMLMTVMQTFTSTTVQCARCHDHKFDPISQRDYYALQAVFAGVDRANRVYDPDADVHARRQALLGERRKVVRGEREWLLSAAARTEVRAWEERMSASSVEWVDIDPRTFVSDGGATLTRQPDGSLLAGGKRPDRDTYTIAAVAPLPLVTAVRLEALPDESLPKGGPGRQDNGNLHLSEFQLLLFEPGTTEAREIKLARPTASFNQDGWTIERALDGNEKSAWGIHPREGERHVAVFELQEPLAMGEQSTLVFVLKQLHGGGHLIGRFRLAVTDAQPAGRAAVLPAAIARILDRNEAQRTEEDRLSLAAHVLRERIDGQLSALPDPLLVYAAASEFEPDGGLKPAGGPRPVHMLSRGDIHRPVEPASPGALSCVSALPARFELDEPGEEGSRRAALARWLADPANPLTWRSIVNRVWHHHFGRGLVDTPNDFGRMGSLPSHPELLDWLATWFRDDAGGSLKQLHRLIVTSATYRQAARSAGGASAEAVTESDPDNRLYARMNRTRLDAEQVRDSVLLFADVLDLRMGGPGDMHFDLKPGHHVTPKVDYSKFDVDSPEARRRGIYRFLFRTLPDPFMDALDCPAGDQLTAVRNASVTVQQALAMWNNAFMANYAARFASRLETVDGSLADKVRHACELVWNRPPSDAESAELSAYALEHGLANLCRVLLNSNEFMFVN